MANPRLIDDLGRVESQAVAMGETARRWLREAKTAREQEFAKALLRHARGSQVAAAAWKHEAHVQD